MFKIDEETLTISLSRGDAATINVTANDGEYQFAVNDVVTLNIYNQKGYTQAPVFSKSVEVTTAGTSVDINLVEEDTDFCPEINKPKLYWYDISLNGDNTFIGYEDKDSDNSGAKKFYILPAKMYGDEGYSKYEAIDYIDYDGASHINLNYTMTPNTKIVMKYELPSGYYNYTPSTLYSERYCLLHFGEDREGFYWDYASEYAGKKRAHIRLRKGSTAYQEDYHYLDKPMILESTDTTLRISYEDGSEEPFAKSDISAFSTYPTKITLFDKTSYSTSSYGKIYSIVITEGTTVTKNLIPVQNKATLRNGLYDTINEQFYPAETNSIVIGGETANTYA